MDRPKEAIERIRSWWAGNSDTDNVLAYLDWLEGKHVVEWPAELTRERLLHLASAIDTSQPNARECWPGQAAALLELAKIAPQKKKRVVNLWEQNNFLQGFKEGCDPNGRDDRRPWRKVAGPIELEE